MHRFALHTIRPELMKDVQCSAVQYHTAEVITHVQYSLAYDTHHMHLSA